MAGFFCQIMHDSMFMTAFRIDSLHCQVSSLDLGVKVKFNCSTLHYLLELLRIRFMNQ